MLICISFQADSSVYWCLTSAFGENSQDGFLKEMKDMFSVLGRFLTIESNVIMPTQVSIVTPDTVFLLLMLHLLFLSVVLRIQLFSSSTVYNGSWQLTTKAQYLNLIGPDF